MNENIKLKRGIICSDNYFNLKSENQDFNNSYLNVIFGEINNCSFNSNNVQNDILSELDFKFNEELFDKSSNKNNFKIFKLLEKIKSRFIETNNYNRNNFILFCNYLKPIENTNFINVVINYCSHYETLKNITYNKCNLHNFNISCNIKENICFKQSTLKYIKIIPTNSDIGNLIFDNSSIFGNFVMKIIGHQLVLDTSKLIADDNGILKFDNIKIRIKNEVNIKNCKIEDNSKIELLFNNYDSKISSNNMLLLENIDAEEIEIEGEEIVNDVNFKLIKNVNIINSKFINLFFHNNTDAQIINFNIHNSEFRSCIFTGQTLTENNINIGDAKSFVKCKFYIFLNDYTFYTSTFNEENIFYKDLDTITFKPNPKDLTPKNLPQFFRGKFECNFITNSTFKKIKFINDFFKLKPGFEFSNITFKDCDFKSYNFKDVTFSECKFINCLLEDTIFITCNFKNCFLNSDKNNIYRNIKFQKCDEIIFNKIENVIFESLEIKNSDLFVINELCNSDFKISDISNINEISINSKGQNSNNIFDEVNVQDSKIREFLVGKFISSSFNNIDYLLDFQKSKHLFNQDNYYKKRCTFKDIRISDFENISICLDDVILNNIEFIDIKVINEFFIVESKISNLNFKNLEISELNFKCSELNNLKFYNCNLLNTPKFLSLKSANKVEFLNTEMFNSNFINIQNEDVFKNIRFENTLIDGSDFSNSDLSYINLSKCKEKLVPKKLCFNNIKVSSITNFSNIDFTNGSINYFKNNHLPIYENCHFSKIDLKINSCKDNPFRAKGSDFSNASFIGCNLDYADLSDAILEEAKFVDCENFINVNIYKSDISKIIFKGDKTEYFDVSKKVFSKIKNFYGVKFIFVNFSETIFEDCNFEVDYDYEDYSNNINKYCLSFNNCRFIKTKFKYDEIKFKFKNIIFENCEFVDVDFSECEFENVKFLNSDFNDVKFKKTKFTDNCYFESVIFNKIDFLEADLPKNNSKFIVPKETLSGKVEFNDIIFSKVELKNFDWSGFKINNIDLSKSTLDNIKLSSIFIDKGDLTDCKLKNINESKEKIKFNDVFTNGLTIEKSCEFCDTGFIEITFSYLNTEDPNIIKTTLAKNHNRPKIIFEIGSKVYKECEPNQVKILKKIFKNENIIRDYVHCEKEEVILPKILNDGFKEFEKSLCDETKKNIEELIIKTDRKQARDNYNNYFSLTGTLDRNTIIKKYFEENKDKIEYFSKDISIGYKSKKKYFDIKLFIDCLNIIKDNAFKERNPNSQSVCSCAKKIYIKEVCVNKKNTYYIGEDGTGFEESINELLESRTSNNAFKKWFISLNYYFDIEIESLSSRKYQKYSSNGSYECADKYNLKDDIIKKFNPTLDKDEEKKGFTGAIIKLTYKGCE